MQESGQTPPVSHTNEQRGAGRRSLGERLFAAVAVAWPLIVYIAYLSVAAHELGVR